MAWSKLVGMSVQQFTFSWRTSTQVFQQYGKLKVPRKRKHVTNLRAKSTVQRFRRLVMSPLLPGVVFSLPQRSFQSFGSLYVCIDVFSQDHKLLTVSAA